MAIAILNTSTLSEAVSKDANEFTVGSTANISVGQVLAVRGTAGLELMRVQEIPVSGRVKVARGVASTRARAHKSGARFFIGDHDDFISVEGASPSEFIRLTGDSGDVPEYALPGTKAWDGAGNEYVCVELTVTVVTGATVFISRDGNFTARVLATGDAGSIGVMAEGATSDQYAWAQIYGSCRAKLVGGSSLATSTGVLQIASSASTPNVGLLAQTTSQASSAHTGHIYGMYPAGASTTGSTSASSETGLAMDVWLNYPFTLRVITS